MNKKQKKMLTRIIIAAVLLIVLHFVPITGVPRFICYLAVYLVIGYDIVKKAFKGIKNGQVFDENFLMAIATIGAFALAVYERSGDYNEAIAVMLFYQIGELFQSYAVGKSRRNITELMDIRPDYANIENDGKLEKVDPDEVEVGSIIVVQPGEKVPIDGVIVEGNSSLNTSALTGESLPRSAKPGDEIISGCINMTGVLKIKTTKEFDESTVSKILELIEESSSRKSRSENFISKFAHYYTPAVCYGALALAILPPLVNLVLLHNPAQWGQWIYRALTFLVISCPCALVISIPLSFFAGIGGASNAGVLVKGSNYLETLAQTKYVVFDKTGTLTKGVFEVVGVSRYLVSAREIQIKMAQGAKPGEGGHLPAKKVYPWIAKTRHSTPGVSLISPPPHHDIYSIEDLAQLIYDLKNSNVYADISVKLVSEAGVGTVAAGVAKAGAQTVLISGYDGGTGAAPRSSIHNAGLPWELGLAETHQTLIMNGLRNRVRIETDGKLMSGRDVVIAALLGAEEFGFATAPLVTMGCVMMRVCNLDTCPVGVATQNPELRKRFRGKPEYVENFMRFIAQEMREYMARLGVRTVDEMVGHTELLKQSAEAVAAEPHKGKLDLSAILNNPYAGNGQKVTFDPKAVYNFELEKTLDEKVLLKKCARAISKAEHVELDVDVTNTDRTFGTILGAEITRQTGTGLPDDTIVINCHGAGGQSFGAFIPKGLTLNLTGDSNDYFGKGLSGGKLIVKVPEKAAYKPEENIIIGNVALYGATSGYAFINGVAGERFAVRNSGAYAVVEGVGEHGCEYMTGGRVVVLGRTGKNFAAGMSGGIAYVLDVDNKLYKNINKAMISIEKVENKYDKKELRDLIEAHVAATGSKLGTKVLDDFDYYLPHFKKLIPNEYKKMITLSAKLEEKGLTSEQAQMEAFYESIGAKH